MFDEKPAVQSEPEVNVAKRDFMLQYILNARLSGRAMDIDSDTERGKLVRCASDLYDRTMGICAPEAGKSNGR